METQPSSFGRKRRPSRTSGAPPPLIPPSPTPGEKAPPPPIPPDPFDSPPCEYHRNLLQTVQPLLNVHPPGGLPAFDKFAGRKMARETLREAIYLLANNYPSTSRLFSRAHTELNIRPRHAALLQNLALLTRPHSNDQACLDLDMYADMSSTSANEAEEDVAGLQIKGGGEKVSRQSASSNERLGVDHEVAPEGVDDRKAKGRSDFRAFVWDKAPLKRTQLSNSIKARLDQKRLALVFESKMVEEVDACSQAACYALPGILWNLQNWHVQPVYLIVLAATRWTYAILDVHGSLAIKDGTFTAADFEAFKEQEKVRWANKDHEGITSAELNERLQVSLANFREMYQANPEATFPNKKYIVGDYYECKQWFLLPATGMRKGALTDGSQRFYEGLLRVIVGERVLQWTPDDVQNACDIQLDLHEELNEIEGFGPTLKQLEHMYDRIEKRIQKKRQRLGALEDLE